MSRRRKAALKPKTVITTLVACSAICLAGIGYVWAKTQIWGLSREIKKLEVRRDELKRVNEGLQRTYAAMCTHERLAARVKELQLGLTAPAPNQLLRLPEPTPLSAHRERESRYYVARRTED
jgi:hypothetical protein